jgi:hypothetical protein
MILDHIQTITANLPTMSDNTSTGLKVAQTHFDARDRLRGRLDDTTVRQAATEVTLWEK